MNDPVQDVFRKAEVVSMTLGPKAHELCGRIENAMHIQPDLNIPYVVKGWLQQGTLSVLYGPPNAGKTFLALDIAHHVQNGMRWMGSRVSQGNVLYIAAEGGAGFKNRLAALEDRAFWILEGALNIGGKGCDAVPLAEAVMKIAEGKAPFRLIIVDTMARVMNGADENAGPDMAKFVAALSALAAHTGAHVMMVHHTGKDAERGMRGHSSLHGAIDTAIFVSKDEYHLVSAKAVKQRDMPVGARVKYWLQEVELGEDEDGDPVTTCIVKPEKEAR